MPERSASPLPVVLVTGATGFVGRSLVERFAGRYDVVALDRDPPARPPAAAEFVPLDVTSDESVDAALERVRASRGPRIGAVVHLAAYFDLTGEPDPRYDAVTVRGTERLLKALQRFDVGQFVFLSSMLVHRPSGHGRPIDEDSPLDDRFPYRRSKLATEALLRERHGPIPLVVLRAAGVYDDRCHSAFLARQVAGIHQRSPTARVYPAALDTGQPYLHLDDLEAAIERSIERRSTLPHETTLLLGETDVMAYDEIQRVVGRRLHDEQWTTRRIAKPIASAGAWFEDKVLGEDPFVRPWMVEIAGDHYAIDIGRAKRLLDWTPRRSLRESLPRMLDALRDDPVGWYRANHLDPSLAAAEAVDAAPTRAPSSADHGGMMQSMRTGHFDLLWVHWLNILLGAWLLASPFAFGSFDVRSFGDAVWHVTQDRGLADPAWRSLMLARSDVATGALIMSFGALSLSPRFAWAQWANAAVGTGLLFAPLVFWSPDAATCANDTLVGALVIAFAILVPMMPGMSMAGMADASDLPPGWTYSPSSYLQRLPIVVLGAFGFLIARVLTAYQLGHIDGVWEPFFHGARGLNGTETIVTSNVSKAWPIADAGLGGVAYLFEVLMGVMGDGRRWRTMPWMVAMFGIVVVPLGVVSIYFIVIQPIVIGTWCTLCLVTAAAMLAMIPLALDELVATGQFLVQGHRRGDPFWRTFFQGGPQPFDGVDHHAGFDAPLATSLASAVRGVDLPWRLVACALLGALLMFTRPLLGTVPPMANSDHLMGAMIVTFSVIAMAEVARPLRFFNVAFGLWLVAAPWFLPGATTTASWVDVTLGIATIGLALRRGRRSDERYGRWDRLIV